MPRARKHLVSLDETPFYHVTSRCVRRAFLCGSDRESGQSYEHRRQWIEDRVRVLSTLFAIDICAYAVMSNHYHLVVKLVPNLLERSSDQDILERWCALFKGPVLVQRFIDGDAMSEAELTAVTNIAHIYRQRLQSLSWFMKCLNEPIARKANAEDRCTGHFWEARFTSQALCSERALLTCMAYVDLNPVRADMAETPETSQYTSIRERVTTQWDVQRAIQDLTRTGELRVFHSAIRPLMCFSDLGDKGPDQGLPITYADYVELVDYSGRLIRRGKRGYIAPNTPPILGRLEFSGDQWIQACTGFEHVYRRGDIRIVKAA